MLLRLMAMALVMTLVSTASAQTTSAADEEARALFEAGRVAYSRGRYAQALEHFKEAYELSKRPLLLMNIANTHDRLRNDREALEAFEEYVRVAPDTPEAETARARIEFLRSRIEAQEQQAAEESPAQVPSPEQAAQAQADQESESGIEVAPAGATDARSDAEPVYKKGWFWGTVGGVVAAGVIVGVAVAVAGGDGGTEDPLPLDMNTRVRGL